MTKWSGKKTMNRQVRVVAVLEKAPSVWGTLIFPIFAKKFREELKKIPGVFWDKSNTRWRFPVDSLGSIEVICDVFGYDFIRKGAETADNLYTIKHISPEHQAILLPPQKKLITNVLVNRKYWNTSEMGLGKTASGLLAAVEAQANHVLFFSRGMVRRHICEEVVKWMRCYGYVPVDADSTDLWEAVASVGMNPDHKFVVVCSHALAHKAFEYKPNWNCIIVDELQYIKTSTTQRTKAIDGLLKRNKNAYQVGLSATPIENEFQDLWSPTDCFWKGRFGTYTKFTNRYGEFEANEYADSGKSLCGLVDDETLVEELRERLTFFSVRATMEEYRHLLPSLHYVTIRSKPSGKKRQLRQLTDQYDRTDLHDEKVESFHLAARECRIPIVIEHVKKHIDSTEKVQIICFTYFRQTAEDLAEACQKICHSNFVHGDQTPEERWQRLDAAKEHKQAIIFGTVDSLGVGIELPHVDVAQFAEIASVPAKTSQAVGRFNRLSSYKDALVEFIILEGTMDEALVERVTKRMNDCNKLIESGKAEKEILKALGLPEITQEEFFTRMRAAADSRAIPIDEYTSFDGY